MRTIREIHQEIEGKSEERAALWQRLSEEYDAGLVAEIRRRGHVVADDAPVLLGFAHRAAQGIL